MTDRVARSGPRWILDTVAFYGVLASLAICFLTWSMTSILIATFALGPAAARLGRNAIRHGFRLHIGLMRCTGIATADLAALDRLREERGLVIVANHPSLLDILLLASRLPNTVCIVKASLFGNPMLAGAKLAGYIRNDAPLPLIRRSSAALRSGLNLLIFPEGTRTRGDRLGEFHPGFALIARAAGAPVQTLFIESNTPYLRKGWPLWRRPEFPLDYRVRLGPRLAVDGRADAFSSALQEVYTAELGGDPRP